MKKEIGQEHIYDNRAASNTLFRCRANNMNMRDRRRQQCGAEKEDLSHFILYCAAYKEERRRNAMLQHPCQQEEDTLIGKFLFDITHIKEMKNTLQYINFGILEKRK